MKQKVIDYQAIKDIAASLRKNFPGISAYSYGYCCSSDYFDGKNNVNEDDYVAAKIYKGGLNNNYRDGKFEMFDKIYFSWQLKEFKLEDIIAVMQKTADSYGYKVITPDNESQCIILTIKEDKQ